MTKNLVAAAFLVAGLLSSSQALAESCRAEVGEDEAQTYVDQCLEVSPATRPPCNAENACELIWNEIARGCAMLGEDAPGFCEDYEE